MIRSLESPATAPRTILRMKRLKSIPTILPLVLFVVSAIRILRSEVPRDGRSLTTIRNDSLKDLQPVLPWLTQEYRYPTTTVAVSSSNDRTLRRPLFLQSSLHTFPMSELNMSSTIPCGQQKCFFLSNNKNETNGYLITRYKPNYPHHFDYLQQTWNLVQEWEQTLTKKQAFRHLFLTDIPPTIYTLTNDELQQLNVPVKQWVQTLQPFPSPYYTAPQVLLERVQMAPTPHVIVKCHVPSTTRNWNTFTSHLPTSDTTTFQTTLQTELTKSLLFITNHPCLMYDFQILVDTQGHVYHFDLDRCFFAPTDATNAVTTTFETDCIPFLTELLLDHHDP